MNAATQQKRKIILHVGFHKTGSSSIQETLSELKMDGIEYVKWGSVSNHSGAFLFAFVQDKSRIYGVSQVPGKLAAVEEWGRNMRAQLTEAISASKAPVLMLSAEGLCGADNIDAVKDFKAFLEPFASEFQVIGYVRPHAELFASVYQQYLKMGTTDSLVVPLYPGLGAQMLLEVFGKAAVTFVRFDRSALIGGDVVLDFAQRIGVAIKTSEVVRTNESLSEEALGVLCCHFAYGAHRMDYPSAMAVQERLQLVLARFGTTKFQFSGPMIQLNLEQVAEDVAWLEENLGVVSVVPDGEGGIGSKEALMQIGAAQLQPLIEFITAETGSRPRFPVYAEARAKVVFLVDYLKDLPRRAAMRLPQIAFNRAETGSGPRVSADAETSARKVAFLIDHLKDVLRQRLEDEFRSRKADRNQACQDEVLVQRRSARVGQELEKPGPETQ